MIKRIETKEELLSLLEKNNNYYYYYSTHEYRDGSWSCGFIKDRDENGHYLLYCFEHKNLLENFYNIDGCLVHEPNASGLNPAIVEPLAEKYFRKYLETGEWSYSFSSPNRS